MFIDQSEVDFFTSSQTHPLSLYIYGPDVTEFTLHWIHAIASDQSCIAELANNVVKQPAWKTTTLLHGKHKHTNTCMYIQWPSALNVLIQQKS